MKGRRDGRRRGFKRGNSTRSEGNLHGDREARVVDTVTVNDKLQCAARGEDAADGCERQRPGGPEDGRRKQGPEEEYDLSHGDSTP